MPIPSFSTFAPTNAFSNIGSVSFVSPTGISAGGAAFNGADLAKLIKILPQLGTRFVAEAMHEARALCDEGLRMSDSVVHRISGELAGSGVVQVISSNEIQFRYDKEYAGYEEFGNRYRSGHKYFRPSAQFIKDNLGQRMQIALKNILGASGL